MTVDPVRKTYWVYSESSLFELVVENEAQDVWEIYLEKGMYDTALRYAKVKKMCCLSPRWLIHPACLQRQHPKGTRSSLRRRTVSSEMDGSSQRLSHTLNVPPVSRRSP